MRRQTWHVFFGAVLAVLGLGVGKASASPIVTFSGAPAGLTFTIESVTPSADLFSADGTSDTFDVTLQLVTSTAYVDVGGTNFLQGISLDVGTSLDAGLLAGFSGLSGLSWSTSPNISVNSSAQCGGADAGAICTEESPAGTNLALDANGTYRWIFKVDLGPSGFAPTTGLIVGIATLENNGQFKKIGGPLQFSGGSLSSDREISESVTVAETPEPASMVLLGTGLAAVLLSRYRARRS
ncbi:MAG: PEP-CTERM sorting domain-containing protein [Vicinamibacterales bacterium]